jgi:hypothetical protein
MSSLESAGAMLSSIHDSFLFGAVQMFVLTFGHPSCSMHTQGYQCLFGCFLIVSWGLLEGGSYHMWVYLSSTQHENLIPYNSLPIPAGGEASRRLPLAWSNFKITLHQWQRPVASVLPLARSLMSKVIRALWDNSALLEDFKRDKSLRFHLREST